MNDLKDRIVRRLQDVLASQGTTFMNLDSMKTFLQWIDQAQHSLFLQWQHDKKEPTATTVTACHTLNLTQPTADTVTCPATPAKIITNTTAAEREELCAAEKCFLCKKPGHMTNTCPQNWMTPLTLQIQELNALKLSKNE